MVSIKKLALKVRIILAPRLFLFCLGLVSLYSCTALVNDNIVHVNYSLQELKLAFEKLAKQPEFLKKYLVDTTKLAKRESYLLDKILLYLQTKHDFLEILLTQELNEAACRACMRQINLLSHFYNNFKALLLKLELFTLGRLEVSKKIFIVERPIHSKELAQISLDLLDRMVYLLEEYWYQIEQNSVEYNFFIEYIFNNDWLNTELLDVLFKKNILKVASYYSWIINIFNGAVKNREISIATLSMKDLPNIYQEYPDLFDQYFVIRTQVALLVLDNEQLKKDLLVDLDSLIKLCASESDAIIKKNNFFSIDGNCLKEKQVKFILDFFHFKLIKAKADTQIGALDFSKNSEKVDILLQYRVLKGCDSFVKLLDHKEYCHYVERYIDLVEYYLDRTEYSVEFMFQVYELVAQLEQIYENHSKGLIPDWINHSFFGFKDKFKSPIAQMITILKNIVLIAFKKEQSGNLFEQIVSGEWINKINLKTMDIWGSGGFSLDLMKNLMQGDSTAFKKTAFKAFVYASPVIALSALNYVYPHLGEDLRKRAITLLGGFINKDTEKQQGSQPLVTQEQSAAFVQLLEEKPELFTKLLEHNSQLINDVTEQVRQKLVFE